MKKFFLQFLIFAAASFSVKAQAPTSTSKDQQYDPKEAFLNVSYKFDKGTITVLVNDVPAYLEMTASTIKEDKYQLLSLDAKTIIATYITSRDKNTVDLVVNADKTKSQQFDLSAYLAKANSDLEKDNVKRKYPVWFLYKSGIK